MLKLISMSKGQQLERNIKYRK